MKPVDPSRDIAAVLYLRRKGIPVRRIARHLQISCRTVFRILDSHDARVKPAAPPGSLLDPYEKAIRTLLEDSPEMRTPSEST